MATWCCELQCNEKLTIKKFEKHSQKSGKNIIYIVVQLIVSMGIIVND
jgi:hypothetical protein